MSQEDVIQDEARAFYAQSWDPSLTVRVWYQRLMTSGWGYPSWPIGLYGRDLSPRLARLARAERRKVGALGPPSGIGPTLLSHMLFEHGSPDQKQRFLTALTLGNETCCQMLSEPDAGSDLAGVRTHAERDGDEWVITGSKIWTSNADLVDFGMLLARTNWDVPKHQGLTFFLIRRDQPGVEVRPLRQMTGDASFNQVFFDQARVAPEDVLGEVNGGWRVTQTFLAHEKNSYNPDSHEGGPFGKVDLDATVEDFQARLARRSGNSAQGRGIGTTIDGLATRFGRRQDGVTRQELAKLWSIRKVMSATNDRAKAKLKAGGRPGAEAAGSKLTVSELTRRQRELGLALQGPYGMLRGADAPSEQFQYFALHTPSLSIAGGTDEIQRNHLGERILGLPAEPRPDRDVAFKDLPGSGR